MSKRRKYHNRGEILIDLTSLLDVIFIILMVVICNNQNAVNNVQAQQEENLKLSEELEAKLQIYTDQVDTFNNLCIVSVNARYEENNITARHIFIKKNGDDEIQIDMIGNNVNEEIEELKQCLQKYIDENSDKPIILSLNEKNEKILYRDEKAILDIFNELKSSYRNVYIK